MAVQLEHERLTAAAKARAFDKATEHLNWVVDKWTHKNKLIEKKEKNRARLALYRRSLWYREAIEEGHA